MSATPGPSARLWRSLAVLLIGALTVFRLWYVLAGCPFDLAPDEAHYWDWSRHPDWSYYSKGPLVAWLIRASCAVCGDTPLGVRLPAVLCGALLSAGLYVLASRTTGRESLGLAAVAASLTLPAFHAGGVLMTIDAPFACLWTWALVAGHKAAVLGNRWAWLAVGLLVALGTLAKFTMLLFPVCLGLYLLADRERLRRSWPGLLAVAAFALAAMLPVLEWNARNGWVTFRHVGGQAGVTVESAGPLGLVRFVGEQFGLLGGVWLVAWLAAVRRPAGDPARAWLWWMSVPVVAGFAVVSLRTRVQPNWPLVGYLAGLVLAVDWCAAAFRSPSPTVRRATAGGLAVGSLLGVGMSAFLLYPVPFRPALLTIAGPPTARQPLPIRRFDPTCRLHGWREVAAVADGVCEEVRKEGCEPVLAGSNWTIPGELAFYGRGHPEVVCVGPGAGDRRSQYECWHPNPIDDPTVYLGRTFVLVSHGPPPDVVDAFDRVEEPILVTHRHAGVAVWECSVTVCRGFRGFRPARGSRY